MGNIISSLADKAKIHVGKKILPNPGDLRIDEKMLEEIDRDEENQKAELKDLPENNPSNAKADQQQNNNLGSSK